MLSVYLLYESWEVVSLHHPRTHFIRLRVHQSIFSLLKMAVLFWKCFTVGAFLRPHRKCFFFQLRRYVLWNIHGSVTSRLVSDSQKKKKKVVKYLLWLLFSMILLHSCARKDWAFGVWLFLNGINLFSIEPSQLLVLVNFTPYLLHWFVVFRNVQFVV